jgi:hypothetical protein
MDGVSSWTRFSAETMPPVAIKSSSHRSLGAREPVFVVGARPDPPPLQEHLRTGDRWHVRNSLL